MVSKQTINRAKKRVELASLKCYDAWDLCDNAEFDRSIARAAYYSAKVKYRKAEDAFNAAYDAYNEAQLKSIRADNRYDAACRLYDKAYLEYKKADDKYMKYVNR